MSDDWLFSEAAQPIVLTDEDRRVERLFGSGEGAWFLKLLRERTVERPAWAPGQDASVGYWREGQDSVVRDIERRIERVRSAAQ
jgi:hypothetical protein